MNINDFLKPEELFRIRNTGSLAESKTSGELKFLIVEKSMTLLDRIKRTSPEAAVEKRAIREFNQMGITDTEGDTGVLVMLSLQEKKVSIKADRAINEKVKPGTWDAFKDIIIQGVQQGKVCEGICKAVEQIGELLAKHFPIRPGDVNEISDEVVIKK
jgi:putative membrane protein